MNEQPTGMANGGGNGSGSAFDVLGRSLEETRAIPCARLVRIPPTGRFLAADGCLASVAQPENGAHERSARNVRRIRARSLRAKHAGSCDVPAAVVRRARPPRSRRAIRKVPV